MQFVDAPTVSRRTKMPFLSASLAVICLWAHLCSVAHLLPSLTAVVAWIDGQHYVSIRIDDNGSRVVLSHDETIGRMSARHSHRVVSQILVAFAESPTAEADHLVDFSQTHVSARRSSAQRSESIPVDHFACILLHASRLTESLRVPFAAASALSISSPAPSVAVARTVVILI